MCATEQVFISDMFKSMSHCHLFCLCCRDVLIDVLMQDGFLIPTAEQLESLDIDSSGTNAPDIVYKAVKHEGLSSRKLNLLLFLFLCRGLCGHVRPMSSSSVFALLVAMFEGLEFIHLYKSDP